MVAVDGKPKATTGGGGLVNRMFPHLTPGANIKFPSPPLSSSPSSSGRSSAEGGVSDGGPAAGAGASRTPSVNLSTDPLPSSGSFAYKLRDNDSDSSLGSLADKVAEFVVPERLPEKIPHKATGG